MKTGARIAAMPKGFLFVAVAAMGIALVVTLHEVFDVAWPQSFIDSLACVGLGVVAGFLPNGRNGGRGQKRP